ncbi:MAG: transcriptional repressor LexA [Deltaproteobacteria bacterium]|nr:transcriptional repressor LexA [Deltaproteobacteria bacterium]
MKSLTNKQSEIYEFIAAWQRDNGYPPTQEEIRAHFGLGSLNAVRNHLALIEKKGYVRLNFGKARGIRLSPLSTQSIPTQNGFIPLYGTIAAGLPIWAVDNLEGHLPISPGLFGGGELFALHVLGDSMIGAGIRNGDIAVIQKRNYVENGEIAAVLIEQEATLKRVYSSPDSLVLKADNPSFHDLKYGKENIDSILILGRYQGIVRTRNIRCSP